jgi:two-component system phosphate regulon response regulator PhoB
MNKILLVEDNAELQALMRLTLDGGEHEIHLASDGQQATHIARSIRPDLMVLDVMMPGAMDGIQVCEWVRSQPELRHTRIIFVTARGQEEDIQLGLRAGGDAYLVKPFSPLELIEKATQLLGGSEAA